MGHVSRSLDSFECIRPTWARTYWDYALQQTPTKAYPQRTEWNVRDSDGTILFTINQNLTGGSRKTFLLAKKHKKPVLHICREGDRWPGKKLRDFIEEYRIAVLNVAGPRASKEPGRALS